MAAAILGLVQGLTEFLPVSSTSHLILVSDALGLSVKIDHRGEGGVVHIKYTDLDQLDAIVSKLEGK